ncbi:MAG: VOC family protein [Thermostichus sp. DG_1_6_bins_120]
MNQSISGIQAIHHLHFYLRDLPYWQEQFCQVWGFQIERQAPHTLDLCQGSLRLRLSQPAHGGDEVDRYLQQHPPGVVDVALAVGQEVVDVVAQLQGRGAEVERMPIQPEAGSAHWCLRTPYGLRHSLIPGSAPASPYRLFSHLDHVVLNVEQGSLQAAAEWYGQVLGWRCLYRYSISTDYSGLESVVIGDPSLGIHLAINEPTSPSSQIQEFLDVHHGPGIQHVALHSPDIVASLRQLRRAGVTFLQVPPSYYANLENQLSTKLGLEKGVGSLFRARICWQDLVEQEILLDVTLPSSEQTPLLLQTFTQPLFHQPTFFFEIIQRLGGATGFGEGNFQALFEALERQQRQRTLARWGR